jgi:hypothetical protein
MFRITLYTLLFFLKMRTFSLFVGGWSVENPSPFYGISKLYIISLACYNTMEYS